MLKGIQNVLQYVNDNWTAIVIVLSLIIALYQKIKAFLQTSNEQKIENAKKQISESMLKWVSDAEYDYADLMKAGSVKRSEVISMIYEKYPILLKVIDQEALTAWIDEQIVNALKNMKKVIEENS